MQDIILLAASFIVIYLLVMAIFSYFILKISGVKEFWAFLFLFIFNTVMIIFGPVFTILLYFYFTKEKRDKEKLKMYTLDMNLLTLSFPIVNMTYGEGPLENLLRSEKVPEERKVKILYYITNKIQNDDMRLMHNTLSSKSDESRLLCFGKINQMEKSINDQINIALKKLEKCHDLQKSSSYRKEIAHLYWEYIYYNLASEDLKSFYLQKAKSFALEALKEKQSESDLFLLLGKVNLEMKEYDEALSAFEKVIQSQSFKKGILPYLAQLYFEKRDFQSLKQIINEIKSIEYSPKILMITSLWRRDACVLLNKKR